MKKHFTLITILFTGLLSIQAQDRVGIGITNPQAQLHTTGDVMFSGVTNDNNLTRVLVQSGTGLLAWRDANTFGNYYWGITGNSGITANNFIGTTDDNPLFIKINNKQKVKINPSSATTGLMGGVVEINVDSLSGNGSGIAIYRAGNVNRWCSSIEFQLNNSSGQKKNFARINGGIQSNIAGSENGLIAFEVTSSGQLPIHAEQVKMVITSEGYVGIGQYYPTAQLHTTETVRFQGITNNNNLTKILVQDNSGLLYWRDESTIRNNTWNTNGNNVVTSQFLGSTNNALLKMRTSNIDRVIVYSANEISTAIDVPTMEILSPSANLGLDGPGLKIFRNASTANWGAAIDFAMNNSLGAKKTYARFNGGIESNTAGNENGFITFEVASSGQIGSLQQQEKMRITSKGFVGIGVSTPTAQLHTTASVRFQNLSEGSGNYLVIDSDGNIYKSAVAPPRTQGLENTAELSTIQAEIERLRSEVHELKNQLKNIQAK